MELQNQNNNNLPILSIVNDSQEQEIYGRKALSADTIQNWLISKLSKDLRLKPNEIDIDQPLASYGIDSITAVSFSGDLENWLGIPLSATLAWDYPSIAALAQHLAEEIGISMSTAKINLNGIRE